MNSKSILCLYKPQKTICFRNLKKHLYKKIACIDFRKRLWLILVYYIYIFKSEYQSLELLTITPQLSLFNRVTTAFKYASVSNQYNDNYNYNVMLLIYHA